ncbi:hypothetical protein Holit_01103 [Hollandina sp. SP2]
MSLFRVFRTRFFKRYARRGFGTAPLREEAQDGILAIWQKQKIVMVTRDVDEAVYRRLA